MKNTHIKILIALMAAALTGLVVLQYIWIKEAISTKEAQFDHNVNDVLQKISHKIEKIEAAELMLNHYKKTNPINFINQVAIGDTTTKKANPTSTHRVQYTQTIQQNDRGMQVQSATYQTTDYEEEVVFIDEEKRVFRVLRKDNDNPRSAFLGIRSQAAPAHLGSGVLVTQVLKDSPAEIAGLQDGDVITALDGKKVRSAKDILDLLSQYEAGNDISISYKTIQRECRMANASPPNQIDDNNLKIPQDFAIRPAFLRQKAFNQTTLATLSERVERNIEHFTSLAFEISTINKPIEERVNPKILEETVQSTLANAGINMKYEYCLQAGSECTIYSNCANNKNLLYTPYRKHLYHEAVFSQPAELLLYFPEKQKYIMGASGLMLGSSLFFNLIIIMIFGFTMHTIIQQKKLSDMKTDFINNMTHELKTPISTIKLACEILTDKHLAFNESRVQRYAHIIDDENKRLQSHVEKVLQYARLEKGQLKLNIERLDMHDILSEALNKISLQVEKKNGDIFTKLEANEFVIEGDRMHLTNVIYNLLDNAIKYAKEEEVPKIEVTTRCSSTHFIVAIKDNGVGMGKETLKKIFDKFYRIPTGNIHNVKGFGLGLSYVKLMLDAHNGEIQASSKPQKGSTFEFALPYDQSIS
ncbi:MAG: ATP-binding protein [Chitinophagales bacterium]